MDNRKACKFFQQGKCNKTDCTFSHDVEVNAVNVVNAAPVKKGKCRNMAETGNCTFGDKCRYSHDMNQVEQTADQPLFERKRPCKFFSLGRCTKGDDCTFSHEAVDPADAEQPRKVIKCRNMVETGNCAFGDKCRYSHA